MPLVLRDRVTGAAAASRAGPSWRRQGEPGPHGLPGTRPWTRPRRSRSRLVGRRSLAGRLRLRARTPQLMDHPFQVQTLAAPVWREGVGVDGDAVLNCPRVRFLAGTVPHGHERCRLLRSRGNAEAVAVSLRSGRCRDGFLGSVRAAVARLRRGALPPVSPRKGVRCRAALGPTRLSRTFPRERGTLRERRALRSGRPRPHAPPPDTDRPPSPRSSPPDSAHFAITPSASACRCASDGASAPAPGAAPSSETAAGASAPRAWSQAASSARRTTAHLGRQTAPNHHHPVLVHPRPQRPRLVPPPVLRLLRLAVHPPPRPARSSSRGRRCPTSPRSAGRPRSRASPPA